MSAPRRILDPLNIPLNGVHSIEASAGTGKTYTITTLYLRYVLEAQQPVDQILVTTFTEAATSELRTRLHERMTAARKLVTECPDGQAARDIGSDGVLVEILERSGAWQSPARTRILDRLEAALLSFDQAPVFTIHGFCNRILQELVFETGSSFSSELVSSVDDLIDEAVRDFVTRHWCDSSPDLTRWLQMDPTLLSSLTKAAKQAAENPACAIVPESTATSTGQLIPEEPVSQQVSALLQELACLWPVAGREIRDLLFAARSTNLLNKQWHGKPGQIEESLDFLNILARTQAPSLLSITPQENGAKVKPEQRRLSQQYLVRSTKAALRDQAPRHRVFEIIDELLALAGDIHRIRTRLRRQLLADIAVATRQCVTRRKRELGIMSFSDLLHQVDRALTGPHGTALLNQLQARYHVAMVDEFQDTDPIQFRIFHRVFHEAAASPDPGEQSSRAFVMIGDPKQSIYRFRGADLQAYLEATRTTPGANRHTMGTNWRSDRSLVRAVQRVFETADNPFLDDSISIAPVDAHADDRLPESDALIVTLVPGPPPRGKNTAPNRNDALQATAAHVAADLSALLQSGQTVPDSDGRQRPLRASDIAVLARNGSHLRAIQDALNELRIPSVLQSDDSVFDSREAEALVHVLRAILNPGSPALLANALQTPVFGRSAVELTEILRDAGRLAETADRFRNWNLAWHREGLIVMWRRLLDEEETVARLAGLVSGERQITNFLHLAELLHRHAMENSTGPDELLRWLESQVSDPDRNDDESQLRLETDANAIQLCTIHKSKGLEWPIVFCPTLWWHQDPGSRTLDVLLSRLGQGSRILDTPEIDVGSDLMDDRVAMHWSQEQAEDRRLLYVALTRARHQCHVHWIAAQDAFRSALGQIITQGDTSAGTDSDDAIAVLLERWLRRLNVERVSLRRISDNDPATTLPAPSDDALIPAAASAPDDFHAASAQWQCRAVTRRSIDAASQTSFTSMTAALTGQHLQHGDGTDTSDSPPAAADDESCSDSLLPLAAMPGGTRIGTLVHDVMETLLTSDWDETRQDGRLPDRADSHLADGMLEIPLDDRWRAPLAAAIHQCLTRPLRAGTTSLRLCDIPQRQLKCEFPFVLGTGNWKTPSTASGSLSGTGFRADDLADALMSAAGTTDAPFRQLLRDYAPRLREVDAPAVRGFLSGFIDLVAVADGKWYVVDYKTNWLGSTVDDYAPDALRETMVRHDYVLQLLLYCVALRHHLRRHRPSCDWDTEFGGVFYLFMRGFADGTDPDAGVFYAKPGAELIDGLSAVLSPEVL